MKRAIQAQIQEEFEFNKEGGSIEFSVEKIEMVFSGSEVRRGSFQIMNLLPARNPLSGFIYSTDLRMEVITKEFTGDEATIEYAFDSSGMEEEDVVSGELIVVTDRGEFQLKFEAVRERTYLYSSLGHIKNLFHFANLAQTNWEEAVQLFYSSRFPSLLQGNDAKYLGIYRGLSADTLNERNVDEFLYAVKKKNRNQLEVKTPRIEIKNPSDEVKKEIEIIRSGWGYTQLTVGTDAEFIELNKDTFHQSDFENNICRIPFIIHADALIQGRNVGHILLGYENKTISVEIRIDNNYKDVKNTAEYRWKRQNVEITRRYIDFRLGKMSLQECARECSPFIEKMIGNGENAVLAKLYQVQILMAQERMKDAAFLLDRAEELITGCEVSPAVYGYYLYLTTMVNKENEYVDKVSSRIKKMYHKDNYDWRLAWFMLYMQEELLVRPEKRLAFLEEQYHLGSTSPVLYVEALQVLKKNPSLLVKLEPFEVSVLLFAAKHLSLGEELSERFQFLVGRERVFQPVLFRILETAFQVKPSKEMLSCIISYLMKGNRNSGEYFKWYELGVIKELRITRLYEFYMDSMDLSYDGDLPKIVMMYFAYQNNLDYEHRAFLYANVLHRRARYPEIAISYSESVEAFVREQVLAGHMNNHLKYLYKRIVNKDLLAEEEVAKAYIPLLFAREIRVNDPEIKRVIVIHDKITGESSYPVENGVAYVPIYSENFRIIYEDARRNRYVSEQMLSPERALWNKELLPVILKTDVSEQVGLLVYMCEDESGFQSVTEDNVYYYSRLLSAEQVTLSYKKEILSLLVNYYFEHDCIRELDELLLNVKPEALNAEDRGNFIKILVARGLYDTAFEWLTEFGVEHTSVNTILRLASRRLERTSFEENEKMIAVCRYLYRKERYDENVLVYLSDHFEGTSRELRELDHIVGAFGLDDYVLLEKLLVQILYTGTLCHDKMEYFNRYVKKGGSMAVQKAFIARCAFDYFVLNESVNEQIIAFSEGLLQEGEELNRVSRLALLKYYSNQPAETWNLSLIKEMLLKEIGNGACFPFFPIYAAKIPEMIKYTDLSFIEYKGNPASRVIIHFCIEHENGAETEYHKEEMDNLYAGIFIRKFILFWGEEIKYYITEENGNREQLTQSSVLKKTEDYGEGVGTGSFRYALLNNALKEEMEGRHEAAGEKIYEYMEKDYLTREIFRIR